MPLLRRLFLPSVALFLSFGSFAEARVSPVPVPQEMRSSQFTVLVNGKPVDVVHAAASYDYLNIETTAAIRISITASEHGFWDRGVDIQPWRLGIRPQRKGDTIQFNLKDPAKLSISRPEDFLNHARMLFVFVSRPATPPAKAITAQAGYHFVEPGIHRGSLNPKSGDTYYLAPGAVILGSLNLWNVHDVAVLGRGVIVYNGTQNPSDDDGWMQKPDWHCIGALNAHKVRITGLTCLVRSRTWSIQMKDSTDFEYDDLRVIGGNPGNANQDGMDWLGGGNTNVRDSFFRTSDDVFAIQGNWDGYGHANMIIPGHDVSNILVEHSVLSTSISNIMRAGWPEKSFSSHNVTLRDSDILHGGIGSCGPPFALFTFWGANGAKGDHSGYTFENLWLDDWYSLFQIEQEQPALHGFTFHNIWALGQPPLLTSMLKGQVTDVRLANVKYGQTLVQSNAQVPLTVSGGAQQPAYTAVDKSVHAAFQISPAVLQPGVTATFTAAATNNLHARYQWSFGDGTTAVGRRVRHRYADAKGTALDTTYANGAGHFRVMLQVVDRQGNKQRDEDWAEQDIAVVGQWHDAGNLNPAGKPTVPGLEYRIYPGTWPELPAFAAETPTVSGVAPTLANANSRGFTRFAIAYDGFLQAPAEGGYNFALLARDGARLLIDGVVVAETGPPFGEVCGSPVNAERYAHGTIGLRAGKHTVRLEALESMSPGSPRLLWEGPGVGFTDVPPEALSHLAGASVQPRPNGPPSTAHP
jgi:PA14 domain/PKD domain